MAQQPPNAFQNPEIIKRLLVTLGCLTAYIVGRAVPVPGIHPDVLLGILSGKSEASMHSVSIFALGVVPYLNAVIVLSLIRAGGWIKALAAADAAGRRGVDRIARFLTAAFAVVMGYFLAARVEGLAGPLSMFMAAGTFAAGSMAVLWLAEEITDDGVGSGVLLILFVEVSARAWGGLSQLNSLLGGEDISLLLAIGVVALTALTIFTTVLLETAQRLTSVQYSKRVIGRKMMGGQQTTIPIKANPAGALGVIAASIVVSWPAPLLALSEYPVVYYPVFAALIVALGWLYRRANIDPKELAGQIRNTGGFIHGIRSGEPMLAHFRRQLSRLALGTGLPITVVVLVPAIVLRAIGSPMAIDGTALFVAAAVTLDMMAQVQSRAMMLGRPGFSR
ncbi:MAG: hypothetical protein V3S11_04585 [Elusimicrobiota bacterium]